MPTGGVHEAMSGSDYGNYADGHNGGYGNNRQEPLPAPVMSQAQIQDMINAANFQGGAMGMPNTMAAAGLQGVQQAASNYNTAPGYDPTGQMPGAINQMAGLGQAQNPFMQGFQNFNSVNPYQTQMANMGGNENPFMSGFQNFQNQQNQYLGGMFDQGATKIQDKMNSMFGASGRTGSGYHAGTTGQALGDFGTNLYGNAFNSMMDRNLQAQQAGANAYANQNQQNIGALNNAGNMFNTSQGLNLDAMGQGSNAFDNQTRNQMAANAYLPDMLQAQSDGAWSNLDNYSRIVGNLNGTQPTPRNKTSGWDKAIGLASLVGGFL